MNNHTFLKPFHERGFWLMAHALLSDAVSLMLLVFVGFMTLEALIPGIITSHISMAKFLFVIIALLFAQIVIGQKHTITFTITKNNRWFIKALLFWSLLLILNALLKFPIYAIIIITLLTIAIVCLFYQLFLPQSKQE